MIPHHHANLQHNQSFLKNYLVLMGLRALRDGDLARVALISQLLAGRSTRHA